MTLLFQCPVCAQGLVFRGGYASGRPRLADRRSRCPMCGAPIRVKSPRLAEPEILNILSQPARPA